jgi:GDP-L-fucose synthase
MEKNAKIYIAGHRGLVGSAIVRQLEKQGFKNLLLRTKAELNLLDQAATFAFLQKEKPEYVFLAAAKVGGIVANMNNLSSFLYENLQIQNNVIEGSRQAKVKKLLFLGSSCIFPKQAENPITENQILTGPLEPTNEGYAIAKIAGIRMCQYYKKEYGCDFISAIPNNLYGINDNYSPEGSHLIPALIRKVHEAKVNQQKSIELWGSGKPRREFMLSDDCAEALVFLMESYSENEPINIGIGEDLSVLEIAQTIAKALGVELEFRLNTSRPDGMARKLLNVDRIRKLGWRHRTSLAEGLLIAYEDFKKKNP